MLPYLKKEFVKEKNITNIEFFKYGSVHDNHPMESINQILKKYINKGIKNIGQELSYDTITPTGWAGEARVLMNKIKNFIIGLDSNISFLDVTHELDKIKSVKTAEEIDKIIITNEIAEIGLKIFNENVVPGNSAVKISSEVEKAILEFGTGYKGNKIARAWANVFVGSDTFKARLEGYSNNKVLNKNELAFIELGVVADGFWSDLTRVFCAGKPNKKIKEIHKIIYSAYMACEGEIKNNIHANEVDKIARNIIKNSNYSENFVHHTGHGLGFKFHESIPKITPFSKDVLKEGMIIAIEPGIYLDGSIGMRIENNLLVRKNDCLRLSFDNFSLKE